MSLSTTFRPSNIPSQIRRFGEKVCFRYKNYGKLTLSTTFSPAPDISLKSNFSKVDDKRRKKRQAIFQSTTKGLYVHISGNVFTDSRSPVRTLSIPTINFFEIPGLKNPLNRGFLKRGFNFLRIFPRSHIGRFR